MYNQVLMVDARTYDRTGYLTSTTRYTVVENQSLAEEIAEDLAFECIDELNEEVRNSDFDDFMNEEYTEADMHKRYVGDENFPELKYITIADKDVPDYMRVVVEITPSTLIKARDDYFSLKSFRDRLDKQELQFLVLSDRLDGGEYIQLIGNYLIRPLA